MKKYKSKQYISQNNHAADLQAYKNNELPPHRRSMLKRQIALLAVAMILIILMIIFVPDGNDQDFMFVVVSIILFFAAFTYLFDKYLTLTNPRIKSVKGPITKSMKEQRSRYGKVKTYYLACEDEQYISEYEVWQTVKDGEFYKLWYIQGLHDKVVAVERL